MATDYLGVLDVSGNATVGGTLGIDGNATVGGDVSVAGGAIAVTNSEHVGLSVTGSSFTAIAIESTGTNTDPNLSLQAKTGNAWTIRNDESASNEFVLRYGAATRLQIDTGGDMTVTGNIAVDGFIDVGTFLRLPAATELTIATGAVAAIQSHHTIDTESNAASDDLDTISGGSAGDILVIQPANDARDVVAKDGSGNLKLAGDMTMDSDSDTLTLLSDGTNWTELARSSNA